MTIDRKLLLAAAAAFALGYYAAQSSPPTPQPIPDRPVLRWLAKAAKNLLWVALVAERPPEPTPANVAKTRLVGEDGYPLVDNAGGW
jgi:hypothetical protein